VAHPTGRIIAVFSHLSISEFEIGHTACIPSATILTGES
jgi:hypothetical protein